MSFDYYSSRLTPYCCGDCGKIPSGGLLRCTACKAIRYCDVECQRRHWRRCHKKECKAMSENRTRWERIVEIDLEGQKSPDAHMGATNLWIIGVRLGLGEDQDPFLPELACKLYEAATTMQKPIEGGHPAAMLHLALHYERGIGVAQSHELAYKYYKSVIDHPQPCMEDVLQGAFLALSRFHRDGMGGAQRTMELATKYYCFGQSNPETKEEIQHLEKWWEEHGFNNVTDDLIGKVLLWDKE